MNWFRRFFAEPAPLAQLTKAEERALKISAMALARARMAEDEAPKTGSFVRYEPPVGVVPKERQSAVMAMDATPYDYLNAVYSTDAYFRGYPYLAALSQLPEYRKISETIAKEMTRKWIKIVSQGDADKSEQVQAIEDAFTKFRVKDIFRDAAEMDGLFGRGQVYIDVKTPKGQAAQDVSGETETPLVLDPKKITKGALLGFRTVEPVWTYPGAWNAQNPLKADYYRPTTWFVMGKTVHSSRLLLFVSREVPDLLKASYNFGGLSLTQMAEPYVKNWLRTRQSVSDMLHSFSVSGVKTNLSAVLAGSDGQSMFDRAQLFANMRDNQNVFMLDKDTEDFFQYNTPLSGLDALQAQAQEQMASVSSIPLVKLLGISPAGLNASSDGEIRVFYDEITGMQERLFRQPLTTVLRVIQLHLFGKIDEEIGFEFQPLYELDALQKAQIRTADATTDQTLITAGVISADDARTRLMADPENGYHGLEANPDDLDEEPGDVDDPSDFKRAQ